jgi:hypothetical protein
MLTGTLKVGTTIFDEYGTPKMEAECCSETSVNIYQTIWCHILEDNILHSHHHKTLKFHSERKSEYSFTLASHAKESLMPYLNLFNQSLCKEKLVQNQNVLEILYNGINWRTCQLK